MGAQANTECMCWPENWVLWMTFSSAGIRTVGQGESGAGHTDQSGVRVTRCSGYCRGTSTHALAATQNPYLIYVYGKC